MKLLLRRPKKIKDPFKKAIITLYKLQLGINSSRNILTATSKKIRKTMKGVNKLLYQTTKNLTLVDKTLISRNRSAGRMKKLNYKKKNLMQCNRQMVTYNTSPGLSHPKQTKKKTTNAPFKHSLLKFRNANIDSFQKNIKIGTPAKSTQKDFYSNSTKEILRKPIGYRNMERRIIDTSLMVSTFSNLHHHSTQKNGKYPTPNCNKKIHIELPTAYLK